jgi:hypothetical protein
MVYSFWSSEFIEIKRKFIKVSFFERLKKSEKKEFIGDIFAEFQLSTSDNFRLSWVVNLVKKLL